MRQLIKKLRKVINNRSKVLYAEKIPGRQEWNDRYGTLQSMMKSWQKGFVGLFILCFILIVALVKLATSSKVQPFVVPMQNGVPCAILPMTTISHEDPRLIRFTIEQYIVNARTVIQDPWAQKSLLDKVYAYSANSVLSFLKTYYEQNNPLENPAKTISVHVINTLPLSAQTWQIIWEEVKHNVTDDHIENISHWMANITYQLGDVNPRFMQINPFGLYVTQIAWSEIQHDEHFENNEAQARN